MTHDIDLQNSQQGEIILYQPDETVRLDVRLEDDTVWLTQAQIVILFQKAKSTISFHISNIFKEGELDEKVVVRKNRTTTLHGAIDGKKQTHEVAYYNLDVIISVGYRVKSLRGTKFRQWATGVIRDHLLHGYSVNYQMRQLEQKIDNQQIDIQEIKQALTDHQGKIDFFVRTSLPPVEGIFYDGQIFDAYAQIVGLIKKAKSSIVLIDNYIDETTLTMLSKRDAKVTATIYTRPLSQQQLLDLQRHNQQYQPITVTPCHHNHDRFLIIDDDVYLFGASLKDAGKKLFAYIKMDETTATDLIKGIR
ncbi:MAG: virulence RhuM family protein [Prevotella sp.]|nr:virulence RhuM family protein [Prevotella sp.]